MRSHLPRTATVISIVGFLTVLLSGARDVASADDAWVTVGDLSHGRFNHTSTVLLDGTVLLAGDTNAAERYHPSTGMFTAAGFTPITPGHGATATRLLDGRVLLVGGDLAPEAAQIYDPASGSWAQIGPPNQPRGFHTATLLADGTVLLAGGWIPLPDNRSLDSAEIFDPANGTFSLIGSLVSARADHTATTLADGRVLLIGGEAERRSLDTAEYFDPVTRTFSAAASLNVFRSNHTATRLLNGDILIVGGGGNALGGRKTTELFDAAAGTFSLGPEVTVARIHHRAAILPSGRVLIAGGYDWDSELITDSVEIYDPVTMSFESGPPMNFARINPAATILPSGEVLVTGGRSGFGALLPLTAELFRESAADAAPPAELGVFDPPIARGGQTLTRFSGGSVASLIDSLQAAGATSATVALEGGLTETVVVTTLAFVNADFQTAFQDGIPAGTILWVKSLE